MGSTADPFNLLAGRASAKAQPAGHQFSQYEALIRNKLSGCWSNRFRMSPVKDSAPSAGRKPWRPWVHTRNSVEPGRYSHRRTTLEWNSFTLKPPAGPLPPYGANRSAYAAARGATSSRKLA